MKRQNNLATRLFLTAGMVEVIAGLLHFAMPYFALQSKGFSFLDQNEVSFVTAGVFSVGILLMAFGALTAYLSSSENTSTKILLCLGVTNSVLWLARIVIEIAYPIKIPLFFIRQPTVILLPLFFLEWLLFFIATLLVYKNSSNNAVQKIAQTASSN